ncbi:ABC transporter permease [Ruminococcus sp. Marseille-P6503]|uniref:ABC transporter permease n=1 Tax=Ruminococcus sp. Marseille-P6503 TaxID=2364796 RepID=UPI000F525B76|nr:ABC transporter permease [Ruminococcus sp. Marseille-P6503]
MNSLFPKLAVQGIRKNGRIYLPYILTCVGMVMMYYIVSYLTYSKSVYQMNGGRDIQMILSWGTGVIAVFAVIFLFYTNSFIIRRRKKEFGLYNILGMGKKNIAVILVWETLIIFLISVGAGLGLGIAFSKLSELVTAKILADEAVFGFTVERQAVKSSVILFAIAFALILLNSLRQIHISKPIELLRSENTGEKPPKARMLLAVLGIVLLAGAYYLSCTIEEPMAALSVFFIAVIMVIAATYILFTVGSVSLCRVLKKNKKYYYKTEHFVSVSSMAYRMKRNGASLASICILSTMVLVMISSTLCLYAGKEDTLHKRYPRDIVIQTYSADGKYTEPVHSAAQKVLEDNAMSPQNLLYYQYLPVAGMLDGSVISFDREEAVLDYGKIKQLFFLTIDEYNRLMDKNETIADDEIIIYATKTDYKYDELTIDGFGTMKIKKQADEFISNGEESSTALSSIFVFVSDMKKIDEIDSFQKKMYGENASILEDYYGFDLDCGEEAEIRVTKDIEKKISSLESKDKAFPNVSIEGLAEKKQSFYSMFGGLFFLGILLSIVFIFAAVLIMYYKQITEGYEDAERFEIMQKVGMTKREIRRSINSQILTVFFAPLLMAGLHIGFAFPILAKLLKLFGLFNTPLLIGVTAGAFAVFAVFYALVYKITSRSYYRIVSK